MKKLLFILTFVLAVAIPLMAQQEAIGVAILKTVDEVGDVTAGVKLNLRATLAYAINHMEGYEAYTRVNMSQIMDEHKFQRDGFVDNNQIKEIGKATGAKYILIAEVATYDETNITVTASIIDIETTKLVKTSDPEIAPIDKEGMRESCIEIARSLLDMGNRSIGGGGTPRTPEGRASGTRGGGGNERRGQDFTETAFGINMRMVYVEGGTFTMGCTSEQGGDCRDDESPTRQTTVGSYYIGMLEVTQGQWQKVMGTTIYQQRDKANTGWSVYGVGPDYPMYYVSWEEAKEFCVRLSRQTGMTYRLPTEAEWEYAARGGIKAEGTKYAGGWSVDDVAWYDGNSGSTTHPCGTKRGNALGLYDMSGNVWEWCEDWYGSQYLQYDSNNPKGAASGSYRVNRGGSWFSNARYCRVSNRFYITPSDRDSYLGFRVVLVL